MTISAARMRAEPEMTSPFDSLTLTWSTLGVVLFRETLTVQKFFDCLNYN
jgi:hypothetical protein